MRIFGLDITFAEKDLSRPDNRGGWWPIIREPYSGAWQRNEELTVDQGQAFHAVFACYTLICSDIAKNKARLVQQDGEIWKPVTHPELSPVLLKPNHYQNRIQFFENWVGSKLARGNTYVLKGRDEAGVVDSLYVLNPDMVEVLVSDEGLVFYKLRRDNLSGQTAEDVVVPAREIIHDRFNCLYHPLVGLSPLFASILAATNGTNIQRSSARLAANGVRPSGLLTAPNRIDPENAERLKRHWETEYAGPAGSSKIAVMGDGLKFEALTMKAEEAQLIEQLKYTAEVVCSTFHVPPYKIGIGSVPTYNNVQALNVEYFSQCIQVLIESIELCLDEGLGIGEGTQIGKKTYGVEFDIANLLRMDSAAQVKMLSEGVTGALIKPNEGRAQLGYGPEPGGDALYLQQQNYSLEALAKRDAKEDPFAKSASGVSEPPAPANDDDAAREAASMIAAIAKGLA